MSELPEITRTMPRMTQYELYESLIETLRENIKELEETVERINDDIRKSV